MSKEITKEEEMILENYDKSLDKAYNLGIDHAIDFFEKYWQPDDTINPSNVKEFIDMLSKLKKTS